MEKDSDVLMRYRAVTNKLKKRFLKKPNVAEGSEQFASLAKNLKNQECPQYAGFCCLAQARCEHTLSNAAGEAQALTNAARAFLEAWKMDEELKVPDYEEHLTASINCYSHAIRNDSQIVPAKTDDKLLIVIGAQDTEPVVHREPASKVHIENKNIALAASLCLEVGNALRRASKVGEAMGHYQRAAELQSHSSLDCLDALSMVASCKMETKDYEGALAVLTEMAYLAHERGGSSVTGNPLGAYCDILAKCEITRVLLLLLLQPTPQRIRPEHAQTLEKYTWESCDSLTETYLGEDLYLLLQSVVMACQSQDLESLRLLQKDLWPLLNSEQNQLIHFIIHEHAHPSGEGI